MRANGWWAMAVWAAGCTVALAQPQAVPADTSPERIQGLITRLGSPQFREREAASRDLETLGEPALAALGQAAESADPETRRRAAEMVERIDARLTTARLLTPARIQLNYADVPLVAAVEDLVRRTGAPLRLPHTPFHYLNRTVTVAAGPVPYWQALDLVCRRAGVYPVAGPLTPTGGSVSVVHATGGNVFQRRFLIRDDLNNLSPPYVTRPIELVDGPNAAGPVHYAGAFRVGIPPSGLPYTVLNADNDYILPVQVLAEPWLQLVTAADIKVSKAIDDQGQSLSAAALEPVDEGVTVQSNIGVPVFQRVIASSSAIDGVRLRRGEKPAKALRELTGSVTVQVRIPDVLTTLEKPATPVRTTVRGDRGVRLQMLEYVGGPDEVQVTVEVALPHTIWPVGAVTNPLAVRPFDAVRLRPPNGVDRNPMVLGSGPLPPATDFQGLSVEDAQGRRLPLVQGSDPDIEWTEGGLACVITARFRREGGAEPARLVFTASRLTAINVPFTLKDVPLP
jgi:hypothetical protein